jgi:hypothetical protein
MVVVAPREYRKFEDDEEDESRTGFNHTPSGKFRKAANLEGFPQMRQKFTTSATRLEKDRLQFT